MPTKDKILTLAEAKKQVNNWQTTGQKVVFTNGCFDIVHLGHIDYLEKAQALGDKLVLGLNTDQSIQVIKGTQRPIIKEESRVRLMAALQFVDAVVLFSDDTPLTLIETLLPNILVKGDDYTVDTIVGSEIVIANGGEVKTVQLVDGYSTSSIIQKIINTEE